MPLRRAPTVALHILATMVVMSATVVCAKSTKPSTLPPTYRLKVVHVYPHDRNAFTQGLLFIDGKLYESTGLYGRSSIRRVDLTSGQVEAESKLPGELFGEGVARVGQRLIQLTWTNRKALVWNLATLKKEAEFNYEGEGWGLCYDGRHLIMSDGSDKLLRRNPTTFAVEGELRVRLGTRPLLHLNELECVGSVIYANVWQDDHIARIDGNTGLVTAWIDASGLLDPTEAKDVDVLNGIAEMSTTGHLLVTGKLWPHLFEVEIITAGKAEEK
jgi:glutaminyl-peptide cyclotransferase